MASAKKRAIVTVASRARVLIKVGVVTALGLALLGSASLAHADNLNNKKHDTQTQIDNNNAQTSKDQAALAQAAAALQTAQQNLVDAQADLVAKQQARQDAQAEDARLSTAASQAQKTLTARQADLTAAQQAVTDGEANIQSQRNTIGSVVQSTAQQNTTLVSWAIALSDLSAPQLSDRIQWASQAFEASQNAMNQLLDAQTQLQAAQDKAQKAEQKAEAAQTAAKQAAQAAADHLTATRRAEASAMQAQQDVSTKVAATNKAQATASAAVKADNAKTAQLKQQLAKIEQQIKDAAAAVKHVTNPPAPPSGPTKPTGLNTSPSAAQTIARNLMPNYGFAASQFSCLVNLWNYESGWRMNARNSSSGAYGIPQALPATKMASAGADWRTNATTQIKWGLGYIKSRYGSPCGAWAHERAHSWY